MTKQERRNPTKRYAKKVRQLTKENRQLREVLNAALKILKAIKEAT